ncbi:hypothetical protein AUQ37_02030 [Candidatus Methanomethylophilus sp. 1R26]|jgi:hypothetical protein|nr:hypothetical protein AUQ37_02030 [Candidatus Methanomethylophilus sp. 1R26]
MKRSDPFDSASFMFVLEAGIEGMTPKVSSGVTRGGEECFITIPGSRPAARAISARLRLVSAVPDSQWIMTGTPASRAISIPLPRMRLELSQISWEQGKWGLPISPIAAALPSSTAFPASSMPRMSMSSAAGSPYLSARPMSRTGYGPTATLTSRPVSSRAVCAIL